MKLAVLMDPLSQLIPYKDTTLAILKRAQTLGWSCMYFTSVDVYCSSGKAYARMTGLTLNDDMHASDWFETKEVADYPLSAFDIILMRKDPPFNLEYIYATYALELAEKEQVLVANKPQSLRDANEKFFTMYFPQCCPKTLVTASIARLKAFWKENHPVIFKPLEGMGGKSVFYVDDNGLNLNVILETLTNHGAFTIMAQQYIPDITHSGDKRILMIDGEPVPYALARFPAQGELRGNLAVGGQGQVVPLTERDHWICKQIGPTLKKKGLYFVGIDVIGKYLTEINVTSPTCLCEISQATSLDIAGDYLRCLQRLKHAGD